MLTIPEAEYELEKGAAENPGPWKAHSVSVAENARRIADKANGMDADRAYVLGLLHDRAESLSGQIYQGDRL